MKKILVLLITFGAFFASSESTAQSNSIYSQTNGVLSAELQAAYQYGVDIGYTLGVTGNQAGLNAALLQSNPPVVYGITGSASQHLEMYRIGLEVGFQTGYGIYLSRDKRDPLFSIGNNDDEE